MIGRLFKRNSKYRDMRFVDYEVYRQISEKRIGHLRKPSVSECETVSIFSENALDVNRVQTSEIESEHFLIRWPEGADAPELIESREQDDSAQVAFKDSVVEDTVFENTVMTVEEKPISKNFPFAKIKREVSGLYGSLGVFSDKKIYSTFIQSELATYPLNLKHFGHPKTFVAERYTLFDQISAWIVLLSDDTCSEFLDAFIDRYVDKPTLFLCAQSKRANCSEKLHNFLYENALSIQ